ncbi:MAG TPA: PD-(D/E)XK nuclease family protein, partial [Vicinamibacterales bacterium]|nr:PD-(D/E)XK nuclease family protein [Vicinamibacterales bacterium]
GERLAYVAATRARDVLVVPGIGDEPYDGGWLAPMNGAVYPPAGAAPAPGPTRGCPAFPSRDSVLNRPDGDPARPATVVPGTYWFEGRIPPEARASSLSARGAPRPVADPAIPRSADRPIPRSPGTYQVVWWDPHVLPLGTQSPYGIRRDDLIAKDGDAAGVEGRLQAYRAWEQERAAVLARGARPSIACMTVTDAAAAGLFASDEPEIETIDLSRVAGRPFGPAFGTLVHATLATVAFDADERVVQTVTRTQARLLGPPDTEGFDEEVYAAAEAVCAAFRHPLFTRVREAEASGRCDRELPIAWRAADGALIEGTIDLAFDDGQTTTVVDFKTDREMGADTARYRRQLAMYCQALAASRGGRVRGVLLRI